jgi:hypothetical protein
MSSSRTSLTSARWNVEALSRRPKNCVSNASIFRTAAMVVRTPAAVGRITDERASFGFGDLVINPFFLERFQKVGHQHFVHPRVRDDARGSHRFLAVVEVHDARHERDLRRRDIEVSQTLRVKTLEEIGRFPQHETWAVFGGLECRVESRHPMSPFRQRWRAIAAQTRRVTPFVPAPSRRRFARQAVAIAMPAVAPASSLPSNRCQLEIDDQSGRPLPIDAKVLIVRTT